MATVLQKLQRNVLCFKMHKAEFRDMKEKTYYILDCSVLLSLSLPPDDLASQLGWTVHLNLVTLSNLVMWGFI